MEVLNKPLETIQKGHVKMFCLWTKTSSQLKKNRRNEMIKLLPKTVNEKWVPNVQHGHHPFSANLVGHLIQW